MTAAIKPNSDARGESGADARAESCTRARPAKADSEQGKRVSAAVGPRALVRQGYGGAEPGIGSWPVRHGSPCPINYIRLPRTCMEFSPGCEM
jgi:hypothetical protein